MPSVGNSTNKFKNWKRPNNWAKTVLTVNHTYIIIQIPAVNYIF